MKRNACLYPGVKEVEAEKDRQYKEKKKHYNDEPDFVSGKPNHKKFKGWTADEVLVWLNMD